MLTKKNFMAIKLQIQSLSSTNCLIEIQADEQQSVIGGFGYGESYLTDAETGTYYHPNTGRNVNKYEAYELDSGQYNPLFNALANTGNLDISGKLDSELKAKYGVESSYVTGSFG
jgi:hypothetical protein